MIIRCILTRISVMVGQSDVLGTLTPKNVHLLTAVLFPVPPGREVWYGCANYMLDISGTVEDRG